MYDVFLFHFLPLSVPFGFIRCNFVVPTTAPSMHHYLLNLSISCRFASSAMLMYGFMLS